LGSTWASLTSLMAFFIPVLRRHLHNGVAPELLRQRQDDQAGVRSTD
jgi:hypothetical protein